MKKITFSIALILILAACVKAPVFKPQGYALVTSNYPIVSFNGADIDNSYRLDIQPGKNSLTVVYNTYQYDYFCVFSWTAEANTAYEITDQENRYPLTLYQWQRKNGLWAVRLNPVDPLGCRKQSNW